MSKFTPTALISRLIIEKKSDTVFIIGGGSSLKKYLPDHSILHNKDVIALNNAYKLFPNAILTHFADKVWWTWGHNETLPKTFKGPVTTCSTNNIFLWDKTPVVCFWQGQHKYLSEKHDTINGNNAGHQGINLAVHIGYENIILLGFDMDSNAKQTHWHNEHKRQNNTNLYNEGMIPNLKTLDQYQDKLAFKIWNVNRESKVKNFDFCDLDKFL